MRVWLAAVGRPGALLATAIAEYERRAQRYWRIEIVEVREERAGKGRTAGQVKAAEAKRLMQRLPPDVDLVALTRAGEAWSSMRLAQYLEGLAVQGRPGVAFLIGGASGLADELLARASHRLSLSSFTLPHELARLVLAEQLYRAGTIVRGEPYHKAAGRAFEREKEP